MLGPHLAFIFKTNTSSKTSATRLYSIIIIVIIIIIIMFFFFCSSHYSPGLRELTRVSLRATGGIMGGYYGQCENDKFLINFQYRLENGLAMTLSHQTVACFNHCDCFIKVRANSYSTTDRTIVTFRAQIYYTLDLYYI